MKSLHTLLGAGVLVAVTALVTQTVVSQEAPKGEEPSAPAAADAENAMMEAWMKAAAPGPHHEHLKPLAGRWAMKVRSRFAPNAEWTESKAVSETKWICGGRFLHQEVEGTGVMDMPFEGLGLMGYDNFKKKVVSAWVDSLGTAIYFQEGTCDESGKVITTHIAHPNPVTGEIMRGRSVYRIESPNRYVLEAYRGLPDGSEFQSMEIVHTRVEK
jgi:hypothetical protein